MDNKHSRFILQSARPGGADDADPQVAGALRDTRRQPELAAWLEREREFDARITARLNEVPPPRGLKDSVLDATPANAPEHKALRWIPLAWAAAVAFLATVAALWLWPDGRRTAFAEFERDMLGVAAGPLRFEATSAEARDLERWLNRRAAVGDVELPAGLKALPGLGCRTLQWRGRPVGLICLKVGEGRALHVFVVAADAMRKAPIEGQARFAKPGAMQTASWRRGDVVYFATGPGDTAELRDALKDLIL